MIGSLKMNFQPGTTDFVVLFSARTLRLFAYGFLSVILALYLAETGLSNSEIGRMLSLTLIGDVVVSLWVTTAVSRMGKKRMLIFGSFLMAAAGMVFVIARNPIVLTLAAIIGIISPSGNEIGPFLSIEQAALSQLVADEKRTTIFSWYNLAGFFATAFGALCGGWLAEILRQFDFTPGEAYRIILSGYAACGLILTLLYAGLSSTVETSAPPAVVYKMGLHRSRKMVLRLSALFALDAFAGGFIIQSMLVYWFHIRFGADTGVLGSIFFSANILAGISALLAARVAKYIGLIRTMVFTHIPSNILLCLVPLMPNLPWAITLLLLRFCISQMDVPTRQSYTMAVVAVDERAAASGITNVARSIGASLSPALCGLFIDRASFINVPIFLAGGLKIIYDLLLYRMFQNIRPPEEKPKKPNATHEHCK